MDAAARTLLVVTGLQREAAIAAGDRAMTLCSGGRPHLLIERLTQISDTATKRPHSEGGQCPFAAVLSFGLAGGLAPHLKIGDVVVGAHVTTSDGSHHTDSAWHAAVTSALADTMRVHSGGVEGHHTVLAQRSDKAALHAATGALAVDMESHLAGDYARRHALSFGIIRVISDPATRSLPDVATEALRPDGSVNLPKVIRSVTESPGQVPALIAAAIDSERAFASLRRVRRLLGPLFGFRPADL
jgi:hopanoid-associated phosphorylase